VKLTAPLSFGARWVAPILPAFFRQYPDVAIDLHLTDAHTDLIGDGFDAALRIAVMEDSSLAARLIVLVRRFLVASPNYIARYGRPQHPRDLGAHQCLSYANRAKRDIWRFTHQTSGEECPISPTGRLRGTSIEALLPTVLEGLAITELPEFAATQYFREKQLEPLLTDWRLPEGGRVSALMPALAAKRCHRVVVQAVSTGQPRCARDPLTIPANQATRGSGLGRRRQVDRFANWIIIT
jgi:DNA-binding transcriptional LysR family regulator